MSESIVLCSSLRVRCRKKFTFAISSSDELLVEYWRDGRQRGYIPTLMFSSTSTSMHLYVTMAIGSGKAIWPICHAMILAGCSQPATSATA